MIVFHSGASADEVDRFDCVSARNAAVFPSAAFEKSTNAQLETTSIADTFMARAAARVLAERYERGIGGPINIEKAVQLYRKAAFVLPVVRGIYTPGFGNVPGSVTMVGADSSITVGDSAALARLGELYRDGIGVPQDSKRAQVFLDCSARLSPKTTASPMSKQPSYFDQFTKPSTTPIPQADSTLLDHETASLSFSSDVTGMAWSPDGKYLAVYFDRGDRLTLVRLADDRRVWTVEKNEGYTSSRERVIQFSPDGQQLYLRAPVGKLEWEQRGRRQLDVLAAVSARDGRVVRVVSEAAPVRGSSGALAIAVDSHAGRILAVGGGVLNKVFAYDTANWDRSVFLELPNGQPNERPEWGHGFTSSKLAIDPDRDILWWAHEGTLEVLKASNAQHLNQIHAFDVEVQAIQINQRTGELVVGGSANSHGQRYPLNDPNGEMRNYRDDPVTLVRAFDPVSGKQTRTYAGPGGTVEGLSVSADGKFVAAVKSRMLGTSSSYVLLWDAESGKLLSAKNCNSSQVRDAAFDPSGTKLAYAVDQKIHIVNLGH